MLLAPKTEYKFKNKKQKIRWFFFVLEMKTNVVGRLQFRKYEYENTKMRFSLIPQAEEVFQKR